MSDGQVTQIRIGNHRVGLIGVKQVIEAVAKECGGKRDDSTCKKLVERISKRNYIPQNVTHLYEIALMQEYKKFIGEPVEEERAAGVEIKVLGPGCAHCDRLEQEVMAVIAEMKIAADVEHVRDVAEIGRFGVMGSPALVVNGEVKTVGLVPSREKLRSWIEQAARQIQA
ncbi:thioredoxin family protein [Thermodesulfobacteriota bacterium]